MKDFQETLLKQQLKKNVIEIKGNLFDQINADAICITTNGFVKKSGEAVMGRGNAKEAKTLWPGIEYRLGSLIDAMGNVPNVLTEEDRGQISMDNYILPYHVVSFPVKVDKGIASLSKANVIEPARFKFNAEQDVPGFYMKASLPLIEMSAKRLKDIADLKGWKRVILPRPGCGNGELEWNQVRDSLDKILDGRFFSISP